MKSTLLLYSGDIAKRGVSRIRKALDKYNPIPLYIQFSGGKDSAAATLLVAETTDDFAMIFLHIVGQTHIDNIRATYEFMKEIKEIFGYNIKSVRIICHRPGDMKRNTYRVLRGDERPLLIHAIVTSYGLGLDYWGTLLKYGFPMPLERSRIGKRYCCDKFKSLWFNELPPNTRKNERVFITGVKRADSTYRRKLWRHNYIIIFDKRARYKDITIAPLVDYTDIEVMLLLKEYGVRSILKQYEKWHRSPNCVLCPLMGKEALRKAVNNLPEQFLEHVLNILNELQPRYNPSSSSFRKINEWRNVIINKIKNRGHHQ